MFCVLCERKTLVPLTFNAQVCALLVFSTMYVFYGHFCVLVLRLDGFRAERLFHINNMLYVMYLSRMFVLF